ncbi:MAG TPA: DUF2946 domain-containing protein [Hyphomicrobiaceae bacterium]|jgi:hypothetical protein
MASRRQRQRVMGWLGIVAVLGNVLASVLSMAPAKAVTAVDDILGPLVLCTEHGPRAVPGSDVSGGGEDNRDGNNGHCSACTLLAAGLALALAVLVAPIAFPERIFRPFPFRARTLADHLSLGGIRSRAPPLPA